MSGLPRCRFDHLERLCDDHGLFEHADGTTPRPEHGYCTDDNARLLGADGPRAGHGDDDRLSRLALQFVLARRTPTADRATG